MYKFLRLRFISLNISMFTKKDKNKKLLRIAVTSIVVAKICRCQNMPFPEFVIARITITMLMVVSIRTGRSVVARRAVARIAIARIAIARIAIAKKKAVASKTVARIAIAQK